jgi:uncharacterized protein
VSVGASVQTNAVGLSDSYLRLFDELGVRIGVSPGGAAEAHDRRRRFASGCGSYAAVSVSLGRLPQFRRLFSGLLCTIDLRNDPIATYEALAGFDPRRSISCYRKGPGRGHRLGGYPTRLRDRTRTG